MRSVESRDARAFVRTLRQRFLNRIRVLGIVREPELIQVHRVAQDRRIAPEDAVVALGLLTEDQVLELLMEDPPGDCAGTR